MKHDNDFIARALDKLKRLGIESTVKVIQILEELWNEAEEYGRKQSNKRS